MIEISRNEGIFRSDFLKQLNIYGYGRPTRMPFVPDGQRVICGYNEGEGERVYICETLEDMQELYDYCVKNKISQINWYLGKDPVLINKI
jgi:hypothetical protein